MTSALSASRLLERHVRGVAVRRLEDHVARVALTPGELGERRRRCTPFHSPPSIDQPVTQWTSAICSTCGSLSSAGVVDLERLLDRAVDLEPEGLDLAVALVAAHRLERLDHALAGRQARAAVGAASRRAPRCVRSSPAMRTQRAADGHERGADRRRLDELAAIPGCLQLGIAIEIGTVASRDLLHAWHTEGDHVVTMSQRAHGCLGAAVDRDQRARGERVRRRGEKRDGLGELARAWASAAWSALRHRRAVGRRVDDRRQHRVDQDALADAARRRAPG